MFYNILLHFPLTCFQMLRLTRSRVGSLLARRAAAALTSSSARMASHGHGTLAMFVFVFYHKSPLYLYNILIRRDVNYKSRHPESKC